MDKYFEMNLHVPKRSHDKLLQAVTKGSPVSIKLDLTGVPQDKLYVTSGQRRKIGQALENGRRDMTLRFSTKQVKHNIKSEGGFLGGILATASRFLPSIIAALLAGTAEAHSDGNGMFLGHRDHTYQIKQMGDGLIFEPATHSKIRGFYVNNGGNIFQGRGILHGLFGKIPLLNLLF